jgi:hypothetical protein
MNLPESACLEESRGENGFHPKIRNAVQRVWNIPRRARSRADRSSAA